MNQIVAILGLAISELLKEEGDSQSIAEMYDTKTDDALEEVLDLYANVSDLKSQVEKITGLDINTLAAIARNNIYREESLDVTLADVVRRYAENLGIDDSENVDISEFDEKTQKGLRFAAEAYAENGEADSNLDYWSNLDVLIKEYVA